VNATSDQSHALKSIDRLADTRRVDTELRSETALSDRGHAQLGERSPWLHQQQQ
jgi:hypothetical protein